MCAVGSVAAKPMRLPIMKFGKNTVSDSILMPSPVLPLMTLFGPIKWPNVSPERRMPEPPLAMAMLPVMSVPILLLTTVTAVRFWLKISMPFNVLPEITLPLINTGFSEASAVARLLWNALICDASTGI